MRLRIWLNTRDVKPLCLSRSGMDADDLVPVDRVLVGVGDPHEERIVEEAPDELHADRQTRRRLAHGEGERRVAGVVEGLGVAGDALGSSAMRLSSTASR